MGECALAWTSEPSWLKPPRPRPPVSRPLLPLTLLLATQPRVCADCDRAQLSLQLAPAVVPLLRERARLERSVHCTTGLAVVRAVVEPARRGEVLDIGERLV